MRVVSGTFNGAGAAVYLCLGFIPDWIKIWALEDADEAYLLWSNQMRAAEMDNGLYYVGSTSSTQQAPLAATEGIEPYEGRQLLTSAMQTTTGYAEGVYLGWDPITDYSKNDAYGYDDDPIDTWTLDTAANRTGHFNEDTPTTISRIGEGSVIRMAEVVHQGIEKRALIESLAAGAGEASDEVTLSRPLTSGTIKSISGMYSLIPIAVGETTPEGVKLNLTSYINENNEIQMFEAGNYDNP